MKKICILALTFVLLFCGCGKADTVSASSEGSGTQAETTGDLSLANVQKEMLSTLNITEYSDISSERLLDLYGIDAADIAQSASFTIMSGAYPYEVVMVQAPDEAAAGRVSEKLQARLTELQNQYKDYDAESYKMAQECTVNADGLVVSLFLSPDHDKMHEILSSAVA